MLYVEFGIILFYFYVINIVLLSSSLVVFSEVGECIFAGSPIGKRVTKRDIAVTVILTTAFWPFQCKSYSAEDSGNIPYIPFHETHFSSSLPVCVVTASLLWQLPHIVRCCFHPLVVCGTGVHGLAPCGCVVLVGSVQGMPMRVRFRIIKTAEPDNSGRPWVFVQEKRQCSHSCSAVNTVSSDYDPISSTLLPHSS